jgi:hypothetical protein
VKLGSTALKNFLAAQATDAALLYADLMTWKLTDGSFIRISGFQTALAPPANSFQPPDGFGKGASINYGGSSAPVAFPLGPPVAPFTWQCKIGTQPDQSTVVLYPRPPGDPDSPAGDLVGVYTWQAACLARLFDGALFSVDRLFMPSPGDYSLGSFVLYFGRVGEITPSRSKISMQVPSLVVLLNAMMPRRIYGAPCTHVFGDAMCLFDRSTRSFSFTCAVGSDQNTLTGATNPTPFDLYDIGSVIGVTGANAGLKKTIFTVRANIVNLVAPFLFPVVPGDQFQLLPGCDHTLQTCTDTFANQVHFGGFPLIPPPESAVAILAGIFSVLSVFC